MLTRGVLVERFDPRERQALGPELLECMLDQPATDAPAAVSLAHHEVRDRADARLAIEPRGDEADDRAVVLGDPDRGVRSVGVAVDVPRLAPAPVVTRNHAEPPLDVLVDRDAVERVARHGFQRLAVRLAV